MIKTPNPTPTGLVDGVAQLWIGGTWRPGASGRTFTSTSPATGEKVSVLTEGDAADVDDAVAAARAAALQLRASTAAQRAGWCEAVAEQLRAREDLLVQTLAVEQGKPLAEAEGEVQTAIQGFVQAAGHAMHLEGSTLPSSDPHKRVLTRREPRGVYAVITPWNFPVNIPVEYLAPAIATGNAVVWVPAPTTSYVAVIMAEALMAAGIPDGAVNLVTGPGAVVGDALVGHHDIDAVAFTGSTATGKSIATRAAGKPLLLELGGNGPTIVFADADLERAADAIAGGAFLNAGQTCAATEVVLVQEEVHDQLADLLEQRIASVQVGEPTDKATTMGPLNNEATAAKTDAHLADARQRGATITGGGREDGKPTDLYYRPALLRRVPAQADIIEHETFGPVLPLVAFATTEDALKIATGPQFGLSSAVWTRSASTGFTVAEALRTGFVNINDSSTYWEIHQPFGGGPGTQSGIGRLGGMHTLLAMTETKTITFDINAF